MTEQQLQKLLDKQAAHLTQAIVGQLRYELKTEINQLRAEIDQKFKDEIDPLAAMISHIYTILDNDLQERAAERQERAAIHHKLYRHEKWINQLAKHTHARLAPE